MEEENINLCLKYDNFISKTPNSTLERQATILSNHIKKRNIIPKTEFNLYNSYAIRNSIGKALKDNKVKGENFELLIRALKDGRTLHYIHIHKDKKESINQLMEEIRRTMEQYNIETKEKK
jgi:citrate lyase alpha subunit